MSAKKVTAIGIFDGVHSGHQLIIKRAKSFGLVTALTFDPHPVSVITPERTPNFLMNLADRVHYLREAGADDVKVINFTKDFAKKSADEFIEEVLVGEMKSGYVVIGDNFSFGHRAEGNPQYLKSVSNKYGFEVEIVKLQEERGSIVSSTRIRNLVIDGDIQRANSLLTRNYFVRGPVVHGEKRGRQIGYPTANIGCAKNATIPADGVYAGFLTVGKDCWPAAISIGTNPTFEGIRARQVEAYAVDQVDLNLYDQPAKLEFTHRLRDTLKFDGLDSLLSQMKLDCEQVRQLTR